MAERLALVRDVLDKLLIDEKGREIGRADGIVLHLRQGLPPRVGEIEAGLTTLLRRVHKGAGERIGALLERLCPMPIEPVRFTFEDFSHRANRIHLAVDGDSDSRLLRAEKWLRRRVIAKIPGGGA